MKDQSCLGWQPELPAMVKLGTSLGLFLANLVKVPMITEFRPIIGLIFFLPDKY